MMNWNISSWVSCTIYLHIPYPWWWGVGVGFVQSYVTGRRTFPGSQPKVFMPLMAPALTCVSPAGWLGIRWLSGRGCKDVAGLCPGKRSPHWYPIHTNGGFLRRCRMPVRLMRLVGIGDRGILGVVGRLCQDP